MKKELILIFGGQSGEHEVSLRSAASVYKHLERSLYNITLIGIAKNGKWYNQDNPNDHDDHDEALAIDCRRERMVSILPMKGFLCGNKLLKADVVFPLIHGTFGEDGTLQGLLEMSGFPYIGATVGGSYMGMDKDVAKRIWKSHGIEVVPYSLVKKQEYTVAKREAIHNTLINDFALPLFVKPSMAGSSVGVSRVEEAEELPRAVLRALSFDTKVLVEPAIKGREIECSVVGNCETESFPLGEVAPTHSFYDYEAKYVDSEGAALIIPAKLTGEQSKELRGIAERAYKALDLRGFARVDFFIEEKSGRILINEVNTIPGFTKISMFPMLCHAGGLGYKKLLNKLIELAEEQFHERHSLSFSNGEK